MNSTVTYRILSKVYDLLDIVFFRRDNFSPRKAACELLEMDEGKILDVCTGTAAVAIDIAKKIKGVRITGIDASKEMLSIAKQKINLQKIDNIKLYQMDAGKLLFQNETFDAVLISLVLHEINEELASRILGEAKRVLKNNGKIIIVEWEAPNTLLEKLPFYVVRKLEPKGFEEFLKCNLKEYFGKHGLKISKVKHCDYTKVLVLNKE